jgi:cyclic pyranopterin phosphate synthase
MKPASGEVTPPSPLIDPCGRVITRLRLGVSNHCTARCFYCRPTGTVAPDRKELSREALLLIAEAAVACGLKTIRFTGGEPLLREDLPALIAGISRLSPRLDLSLTTNGLLLAAQAAKLAEAGLHRVNVSLDTLREERYLAITGQPSLPLVLTGLEAAVAAGLTPIKINAVLVRGVNDDEILDLVTFAYKGGYHMRFIEYMPLDGGGKWQPQDLVPVEEIRATIEKRFALTPVLNQESPGEEYLLEGGPGRISLIGAISRPFCGRCNRLRITADGVLLPCLFSAREIALGPALEAINPKEALTTAFQQAAAAKPEKHDIGGENFILPRRAMYSVGG